ncbi:MAG: hypothetical protein KA963_00810 [Candidatus Cloacimonas sp.]|nr:hypothetical protein [Candidatus Cloacimonas sp.]HPS60841.1 hypothetical protein [Candidatus Cloacimonas sp.]
MKKIGICYNRSTNSLVEKEFGNYLSPDCIFWVAKAVMPINFVCLPVYHRKGLSSNNTGFFTI